MAPFPAMRLVGFISCLPVLCVASWSAGHCGVDRPGGTFVNASASTTAACYSMCISDPVCRAWVFTDGRCELKEVIPPQKRSVSKVCSGVRTLGLKPLKYSTYSLGSIKPKGWLRTQLVIMANGLSGHLDLFWDDVHESVWIGGTADHSGAGHERGPYWLNGMVPLSALLNATGDTLASGTLLEDVAGQTSKWVGYILDQQNKTTGWLGPDDGFGGTGNTYWNGWNIAASLIQFADAVKTTDLAMAERCNYAVLQYILEVHRRMLDVPTTSWSQNRWQDWAYIIHWLMDQAPQGHEQALWDAAELTQQQSWDWDAYYDQLGHGTTGAFKNVTMPIFPEMDVGGWLVLRRDAAKNSGVKLTDNDRYRDVHAQEHVNNAMGTKSNAVWGRQDTTYDASANARKKLAMQDKFHGQPYGMFSADENFGGRALNRGIELCAVVEQMYSLYIMFKNLGDTHFLDRAERIAFNALPGTIDPIMWRHQYLQQANGINAKYGLPQHVWRTDGPDSTGFGVAPNFGCCTANMQQGWPKFAAMATFMRNEADGSVVVAMLAPARLEIPDGGGAAVDVETDYPFGDIVTITVTAATAPSAVQMKSIWIRIPVWASRATANVHSSATTPTEINANGTLWKVDLVEGAIKVEIDLKPQIRVERGWGLAPQPAPTPVVYSTAGATIPAADADSDFSFSGGASSVTSRLEGASFDIRSGSPQEPTSTVILKHNVYGLGHNLSSLDFNFRYIAGYGGHNATSSPTTMSIIAFVNGSSDANILWTSAPLGNYSWDAGDPYSPAVTVSLRDLAFPNAAPLLIALRFKNNDRNVQIAVPKSGLAMSLGWESAMAPGPTPTPPGPSVVPGTNAVAVLRGPILWTVHLEQHVAAVVKTYEPFKNTDVSLETNSTWNYALNLSAPLTFVPQGGLNKELPFNTSNYFATIEGTARLLPGWVEATNAAAEPPASPVDCVQQNCGAEQKIMLVPYGSTNLRMSGIPWF